MPTKKPRLQIILEEEYYEKYKKICKLHDRTESKLGKRIIEKYIDDYEIQFGKIDIKEEN